MSAKQLPLIGVTGDTHPDKDADYYKVGDKYILSVVRAANCLALMIPPIGDELQTDALLEHLDGVFFTGSPSDLEPHHYGETNVKETSHRDPGRDATNLPMIRKVLDRGLPLFCVCRGHQELNVVMGGTLHQAVHEIEGNRDHRADNEKPYDVRYGPQHPIHIQPGGLLEQINGGLDDVIVNTVHGQAIDKVGDGLRVEAVADDGVIEAVSVEGAKDFALSLQWHPEHHVALETPLNRKIFEAFGDAARAHMRKRLGIAEQAA